MLNIGVHFDKYYKNKQKTDLASSLLKEEQVQTCCLKSLYFPHDYMTILDLYFFSLDCPCLWIKF